MIRVKHRSDENKKDERERGKLVVAHGEEKTRDFHSPVSSRKKENDW